MKKKKKCITTPTLKTNVVNRFEIENQTIIELWHFINKTNRTDILPDNYIEAIVGYVRDFDYDDTVIATGKLGQRLFDCVTAMSQYLDKSQIAYVSENKLKAMETKLNLDCSIIKNNPSIKHKGETYYSIDKSLDSNKQFIKEVENFRYVDEMEKCDIKNCDDTATKHSKYGLLPVKKHKYMRNYVDELLQSIKIMQETMPCDRLENLISELVIVKDYLNRIDLKPITTISKKDYYEIDKLEYHQIIIEFQLNVGVCIDSKYYVEIPIDVIKDIKEKLSNPSLNHKEFEKVEWIITNIIMFRDNVKLAKVPLHSENLTIIDIINDEIDSFYNRLLKPTLQSPNTVSCNCKHMSDGCNEDGKCIYDGDIEEEDWDEEDLDDYCDEESCDENDDECADCSCCNCNYENLSADEVKDCIETAMKEISNQCDGLLRILNSNEKNPEKGYNMGELNISNISTFCINNQILLTEMISFIDSRSPKKSIPKTVVAEMINYIYNKQKSIKK